MKVLVIGGTKFVGRHIVEAALDSGHDVTLFNRGKTNNELFPQIEKLQGDRVKDLDLLRGRSFDAVIDTCGYLPRVVEKSVQALKTSCDRYVFISTGSVYKDKRKIGLMEDDELEVPRNFDASEMTDDAYGELKAGCEQVVRETFADRALIIRPGIIVGPHDPTDRFTYWPVRIAAGGKVLAPGGKDRPVQFIDARDLAEWTISLIERKVSGIYNAIGPDYVLTMSRFLSECLAATQSGAELVWINDQDLLNRVENRWGELPFWIPENSDESGFWSRDNSRAIAAGLKFRPLSQTIKDTLNWWQRERIGSELKSGMTRDRELQLLATSV